MPVQEFLNVRKRFPELTEEECDKQLQRRDRIMERIRLEPFTLLNEKDFEDWVEKASRQVLRFRVSPALFQEAWEAVSSDHLANVIAAYPPTNHETLVQAIAQDLFPHRLHITQLEEEFLRGNRRPSVLETREWVCSTLARLIRVAKRHHYQI